MLMQVKHDTLIDRAVQKRYLDLASKDRAEHQPGAGWFMVGVQGKEAKTATHLSNAGLKVWLPETTQSKLVRVRRGWSRKKRERKYVRQEKRFSVIPGHVLIKFIPSPETYHAIVNMRGVRNIFCDPMSFADPDTNRRLSSALTPKMVEYIADLETKNHGVRDFEQLKPGTPIKVNEAPFEGHIAIVSTKKAVFGMVFAEIKIFGRLVPLCLGQDQFDVVDLKKP